MMVQMVTDSGLRFWSLILVSDSRIPVSDPENPIADLDILVSDSPSPIRLSGFPILVSDSDAALFSLLRFAARACERQEFQ